MTTRHLSASLFGALSIFVVAGCSTASNDASTGNGENDVTADTCGSKIESSALSAAKKTDATSTIASVSTLYGDKDGYADAVLVRVAGKAQSDYIVVRSRLKDDVVVPNRCDLSSPYLVAQGKVPDDGLLAGRIEGSKCMRDLKAAVLTEAQKINETASIEGAKQVYGGDGSMGGAVIVRVSDETEPSDYLAVFKMDAPQPAADFVCKVTLVKLLNSGVLPDLEKVGPPAAAPACKRADGTNAAIGESYPDSDGCNTCECTADGPSCTEVFCG